MPRTLKTILKVFLTAFLILLGLIIFYICIVLCTARINYKHYTGFCPSNLVNTKWVCQEEEILLITYPEENMYPTSFEHEESLTYTPPAGPGAGKRLISSGIARVSGTAKPFSIYFPYRFDSFHIFSIHPETGETEYEFGGSAEYSDGICILTYNAEDDENHFWGEKQGG